MFHRITAAAVAALFVLIAAPPGAAAQRVADAPSEADLEQARQHFMKGRELFEAKDFTGAIDAFKESYRLSRNPLLLYNIGFTLDELGDRNMALFYYKKFLADAPPDAQNRDLVVQRVRALEREAEADTMFSGGGEGTDASTGAATPSHEPVTEFMHNIIEESPPGKPIDVTCFVPDGAGWQVTVSYRAAGEARFTSIDMRQRYNELVGRIPAAVTSGATTVQYYVEARDRTGKVVARSGMSTSPNLIVLTETATPRYYPDLTDDPDRVGAGGAAGTTPRARSRRSTGDGSFTDTESSKFQYTKWGATGGAAALLGLSVTFYFIAADASSSLEGEAVRSTNLDECARLPSQSPTFPCFTYDVRKKDLESKGRRYQTMSNVTLALGIASAAAAAGLWYWEIREQNKEEGAGGGGISAAPVISPDFVGGAAAVRF